jgi:hypothetical protein
MNAFIFPANEVAGTIDQFPITAAFIMKTITSYESMRFILYGEYGTDEEGVDESYVTAYHNDLDALPTAELLNAIEEFHLAELNQWELGMIEGLASAVCRKIAPEGSYMDHDVFVSWCNLQWGGDAPVTAFMELCFAVSRFEAKSESNAHCSVLEGAL